MKTINIDFVWTGSVVTYTGRSILKITGSTPGEKPLTVKLSLAPAEVGYLAEALHELVRKQQSTLDEVISKLRGDS